MSWTRPRSPVTIQVGRPVAAAAPRRTRPARRSRWRRGWRGSARRRRGRRQERLLVADRHARGREDEVAVGVRRARAACTPGSLSSLERRELGLDRPTPRAAARASSQARPPARGAAVAVEPLGEPAASGRGRRGRSPPAGSGRLVPAARGVEDDLAQPRRCEPSHWRSGLAGRHVAEAQDQLGRERPRARGGRSRRRPRRPASGRGPRARAARSARPGSGSRPRSASAATAPASPGSGWRPATIRPRGRAAIRSASSSSSAASAAAGRGRPRSAAARRGPRAPAGRVAVTSLSAGSGPAARARRRSGAPGPAAARRARRRRRGRRPSGSGAGRRRRPRGCRPRRTSAPRIAVELELVDRLAGADPAQLRRPVGGEHDQRHAGLVGLDDGGVEVGRRRARGAEDRRRRARSPAPRRARRSRRERSSRPRPASIAGWRHSASASGVEREPGEITARRTPQRASSSTIAEASAVLRLVGSIAANASSALADRCRSSASSSISTPRPGPVGEVQERRRAARTRRRDRLENRRWVARPWASPAAVLAGQRLGGVRRGGDPDGALEGAREVDGDLARRSRPPRDPADLRELHGRERRRRPARAARSRLWRWSTLSSAASGIVVAAATRGHLLQRRDRLLGELDRRAARARRSTPTRLVGAPGAVGVDPDPRVRADRLAHRRDLRDVVRRPDLELEGRRSRAPPSAASAATPARVAGGEGRVAARPARARAPSSRHSGSPATLPARSCSAISSAPAPARAAAARLRVDERVDRGGQCALRASVARSSAARRRVPARSRARPRRASAPPRSDSGAASPRPSSPRRSRSRSSTSSRRSSVPRAVT